MKYAYISINVADLWSEARFNSERINQALYTDIISVGQKRNKFLRVTKIDGYSGWCNERYLIPISGRNAKDYMLANKKMVCTQSAVIKGTDSKPIEPHFVYYGTKLRVVSTRKGKAKVKLPDNSTIMISDTKIMKMQKNKITGPTIVREAKKFLGVPYLWGGLSPAGFDCSGLVQAVYGRFGIDIARDTRDQIKSGQKISVDNIRTGDLLFFDRHVGFAIGQEHLIHSSVGGGGVRINSLLPDGDAYREDLHHSFKTARRII